MAGMEQMSKSQRRAHKSLKNANPRSRKRHDEAVPEGHDKSQLRIRKSRRRPRLTSQASSQDESGEGGDVDTDQEEDLVEEGEFEEDEDDEDRPAKKTRYACLAPAAVPILH